MSPIEAQLVDMKLALAKRLRETREHHRVTQADLAQRMGSSQSRVAKMEAADASVSMDLLMHALLAVGAGRQQIADALALRPEREGP